MEYRIAEVQNAKRAKPQKIKSPKRGFPLPVPIFQQVNMDQLPSLMDDPPQESFHSVPIIQQTLSPQQPPVSPQHQNMMSPIQQHSLSPHTQAPSPQPPAQPQQVPSPYHTPPPSQTSKQSGKAPDKNTLITMLKLLRQYNLRGTEEQLKKEINVNDLGIDPNDSEIGDLLSAYESEGDPNLYEDAYQDLKKFIENSLDVYKYELGLVLYPVLVHMYIELVYNGHEHQATEMLHKHLMDHEPHYQEDLRKLSSVTKRDQIRTNEIAETFRSTEFIIRMSRDTLSLLKRHLQEKKHTVLLNIVQEHLYFDMYEGAARSKVHIASVSGGLTGEATRQDNKAKIYYGMPREPDLQNTIAVPDDDEEEAGEGGDKPKKKKAKKDSMFSKKTKSDPNAPPVDRIPLPPLKDSEKIDKLKALREATKRVTLGPESLPSIACYTLLNARQQVTCAEISEDVSILAVGFSESYIKLWSLVPQKLKAMKSSDQLQDIEMECDDILVRIMDERNAETTRTLVGHEGPVRKLSFSPDRSLLLSCSQDNTIRLWSLLLWRCLVVYKGHGHPVWDIKFSPHGYYFASAGHDRMARLWATDSYHPLRLFVGHYSDVDCVQFHPNSNYVATGSSDRTIRLWDCVTGSHVRLLTGHKAPVYALSFSVCGRFLASAGGDGNVHMWDLSNGHLLTLLTGHTDVVRALCFSRDGNILASSGQDCSVKLWDFAKLSDEVGTEEVNLSHSADIKNSSLAYLVRSYKTKASPLLHLIFSRRNILLTVATHDSS
ncbi:hypothetical protein M8J75_009671 [Diaphorina citri]|nr:hypothetical protein M8J75_009671 [Diaphorina citri]